MLFKQELFNDFESMLLQKLDVTINALFKTTILINLIFWEEHDSNIESKTLNNLLLMIIKILNKFKIFEDHRISKCSNIVDYAKPTI